MSLAKNVYSETLASVFESWGSSFAINNQRAIFAWFQTFLVLLVLLLEKIF